MEDVNNIPTATVEDDFIDLPIFFSPGGFQRLMDCQLEFFRELKLVEDVE